MNAKTVIHPSTGSHLEEVTRTVIRPSTGSHLEEVTRRVREHHGDIEKTKPVENMDGPRSNVIAENSHRTAMLHALQSISRIVSRTLGPYGGNTLVSDKNGLHFATKDGFTVLNRISFVQETANMVLDNVRAISRAMVRKVGDGSTSSVVIAEALYTNILKNLDVEKSPSAILQQILNEIALKIANEVTAVARKVTIEDIVEIASISVNNNREIGLLVSAAYDIGGEHANVTAIQSQTEETTISEMDGYRVLRGMAHECFANRVGANGNTKTTARLEDVHVLIFSDLVDQNIFNTVIGPILNQVLKDGKAFVLVAKEYSSDVMQIVANFMRSSPGARILMLDHASATRRGAARMGDLATLLSTKTFSREQLPPPDPTTYTEFLGHADGVTSTLSETVFIKALRSEEVVWRISELKAQYERLDKTNVTEELRDELNELKSRIIALEGSEVTINVGGATEQEKEALTFLVEDAILAVKSAKRNGIVEGMGFTALRFLSNDENRKRIGDEITEKLAEHSAFPYESIRELTKTLLDIVRIAYYDAAARVFTNACLSTNIIDKCISENKAYNIISSEFTDVNKTVVVSPAETDIEAIRSAMSIVAILLTSNQTVLMHPVLHGGLD